MLSQGSIAGVVGATFLSTMPYSFSGMAINLLGISGSTYASIYGYKPSPKESLSGIVCRCETRHLMMRGCNCGAMKAELAQARRGG